MPCGRPSLKLLYSRFGVSARRAGSLRPSFYLVGYPMPFASDLRAGFGRVVFEGSLGVIKSELQEKGAQESSNGSTQLRVAAMIRQTLNG
jgi:hypothetical protein